MPRPVALPRFVLSIAALATAVSAAPAVAACAVAPPNGSRIGGTLELLPDGHDVGIVAGSDGDALVKLRDAATGDLALAYFVAAGQRVRIRGIPDGDYLLQYVVGRTLEPDCRTFRTIVRSGQIPREDVLRTERSENDDEQRIVRLTVTYSLDRRASRNVRTQRLDPTAFAAD